MKYKRRLTDIEQEKSMYAIYFIILVICVFSLLSLKPGSFSITGYAVADTRNLAPIIAEEKPYIDYANISVENITQELALNAILQAEKDMQEMQEQGFGIVWVNDTLIEAKKYFEGENYTALLGDIKGIEDLERREKARSLLIEAQKKIGVPVDYKKVLEKTKAINERKKRSYEIIDYIRAAELRIEETEVKLREELLSSIFRGSITGAAVVDTGNLTHMAEDGLDMTSASELLDKAKIEFKEERFEDTINLLNDVEPKINEIKAENTVAKTAYRAGKETTINFIKEYYIAIIAGLIIITSIFLLFYNRVMVRILKRKIHDMNVEEEVLMDLIKKAQSDYYSKGIIPKQNYEIKLSKYKERILEIKHQLPVIQARLKKLASIKRII